MIALVFGMLLGLGGFATPDMERAKRAYGDGRYGEALALFEAALSEPGMAEGSLLYNLGNCAFRLDRYAEAILFYKRAQLRMPRDGMVKFNLSWAEQQLGIDTPAGESFAAAVVGLADSFLPGELLALVGVLLVAGLVGMVLLQRQRAARNAMALIVLIALAGAAHLVQSQWFPSSPEGVVMEDKIAVRSEPHADMPVVLELRAGETVRVEEASDCWARIVHDQGGGWIERAAVGVVD
jgi:tetratricopeptide (TPR) repeat protein